MPGIDGGNAARPRRRRQTCPGTTFSSAPTKASSGRVGLLDPSRLGSAQAPQRPGCPPHPCHGENAHTQVYQDVSVSPRTAYRASVWVQAVDLHGKGFGTHAGDSAGLRVIEMDAAGKMLVEHPIVAVTKAGDYKQLSQSFTTTADTAKVRFLLDTIIYCR